MVTKRGGGINSEFGIRIYTLLYMKQITNKDLLYSTGNSTQYLVKEYLCVCVCVCVYIYTHTYLYITESLCCILETNTTL